ncbi:MAG: alpha/beta hydrolase [Bacteroidota bacterium]
MSQRLFTYKNSLVSYHRFGEGGQVLIAFHGYNQTGAEYAYFEETLGAYFTIIAIDFFWHGQSRWTEKDDFSDEHMKQIFTGIAQQEDLHAKRFSVCSFSMGARLARALVRNFAERIDHFILLSPPTFSFNSFLNFTTNNPFGLALFRYFVNTPGALQSWVEKLKKLKILNRSVYVFTSKFVGKPERVEKVFNTWYAQRKLQTNFKTFANTLDRHDIKVVLIVGENDAITPPQRMISYIKKLKHNKVFILRKKHELATPETRKVLEELFGKN